MMSSPSTEAGQQRGRAHALPRLRFAEPIGLPARRPQAFQTLASAWAWARLGVEAEVWLEGEVRSWGAALPGVPPAGLRVRHVAGSRSLFSLARRLAARSGVWLVRGRRRGRLSLAPERTVVEWHQAPGPIPREVREEALHVAVSQGILELLEAQGVRHRVLLPNAGVEVSRARLERRLERLPARHTVLTVSTGRREEEERLWAPLAQGLATRGWRLLVLGPSGIGYRTGPALEGLLDSALAQLALYRPGQHTERLASPLRAAAAAPSGVPLVATDWPAVRAVAGAGAWWVPWSEGTGGVVRALDEIAADPAEAARRARASALGAWTWTARARRLAEVVLAWRGAQADGTAP